MENGFISITIRSNVLLVWMADERVLMHMIATKIYVFENYKIISQFT